MLEPEIAVALPDAVLRHPGGEPIPLRVERPELEATDVVEGRPFQEIAEERLDLREVLVDVAAQDLGRPQCRRRARRRQERGQLLRRGGEALGPQDAPAQHRGGAGPVGQPSHVNRPVDDRVAAIAVEGQPVRRRADRLDTQIDTGGEAPVEAHLVLAGAPPGVRRAKVEEAQVDGPLHLPDVVPDQKHPRRVRGPQRHRARPSAFVGLGPPQIADQLGHVRRCHDGMPWPRAGHGSAIP